MALKVVRPGLFTTVQDSGRWGFQARGVPVSGAMDPVSHRVANALVGNRDDSATLEVTLTGPEIEFLDAAVFSIAGAVFRLTLDGQPIATQRPHEAAAGSVLKFGERVKGARSYLSLAGGIDVPIVLGSRATHVVSRMGGFDGRALKAGDILRTGSGPVIKTVIASDPILPDGGAKLRVIGNRAAASLTGHRFTISPRSDRMGYRLDGPTCVGRLTGSMISSAVPTGAIQLPPTGQPILLMADHATAGGYEVAATVISADLPLAGQLGPGDWVEFHPCELREADAALREQEAAFAGR